MEVMETPLMRHTRFVPRSVEDARDDVPETLHAARTQAAVGRRFCAG